MGLNKKICLVGSSASPLGRGLGELIDSHDQVVRIKHLPDPSRGEDLGTKSNVYLILDRQITSNDKFIDYVNCHMFDNVVILDLWRAIRLPIHEVLVKSFINESKSAVIYAPVDDILNYYRRFTGWCPTTGMCAILYYLSLGYEHVSIVGFGLPGDINVDISKLMSILPIPNDTDWKYEVQPIFLEGTSKSPDIHTHSIHTEMKIWNYLCSIGKIKRLEE